MIIDATDVSYRELNARVRGAAAEGEREFTLEHLAGQRYVGAGLGEGVHIRITGIPGNDLAAFMNGARITVEGNVQDGVANTMNAGEIVVHGDAGDILGHSMRGGRVLVKGGVGYRACIHMKAFGAQRPAVVVGGTAGDYLGEYMAGGVLVVLGLDAGDVSPVGQYVGTGMHGGEIYIRGRVAPHQLGAEVGVGSPSNDDWCTVSGLIGAFAEAFDMDGRTFAADEFVKLTPRSSRPYGTLYAY